jgi:hypothetical protein
MGRIKIRARKDWSKAKSNSAGQTLNPIFPCPASKAYVSSTRLEKPSLYELANYSLHASLLDWLCSLPAAFLDRHSTFLASVIS